MVPRPDLVSDVAQTLRTHCRSGEWERGVDRLVDFASHLALRRLHGRISAAARAVGTSPAGMTTSVVAGLFSAKPGEQPPIVTALADYFDSDDTTLFLRFQAVVVGAASQELFHRWHENDSLSARLWRNLQRALRHDERLVLVPSGRPEWVCLADQQGYRADKASAGYSDLEAIARARYTASGITADMVVQLLQDVSELQSFSIVVSIELLFSVLRDQTRELAAAEMRAVNSAAISNPLLIMAVNEATTAAHTEMQSRLQSYQTKSKVTLEEACLMGKALSDIITDCADGGPAQSYYQYLKAHSPVLELARYRSEWRTRFEYVAESVRERFFQCLRDRMKSQFLRDEARATTAQWKPWESHR